MDLNLSDCFVAAESRDALERRDLRLWRHPSFVFGSSYYALETVRSHGSPGGRLRTESPSRKRASIPHPERMVQAAPAFGVAPSEKRTLDLVTDHPMIPREHLARWLGVSEGRVSQTMHSLVDAWGLVERHGTRGATRYTLSAEGIRYVTHRDRAQLPTTRGIWSTALTTDRQGRRRHVGHRIDTWARQTKHADGISWFLSKLEAEARATLGSELLWSVPTARSDRAFNWGESAIAPDAVGKVVAAGLHVPFYLEYELCARHPRGALARLRPYTRYYWSTAPGDDQPPFPTTLFVVDREDVEATYVNTASRMSLMSLPILVSCSPVLSRTGILGRSWRPLWEPESPRLALSELAGYGWDALYHRVHARATADVSADSEGRAMDEPVRWVSKGEAAREMEISLSTLDRMIRKGEVEVVREGRRVYVRMHGPAYLSDDELLRRALDRAKELRQTALDWESAAWKLEQERDEARESAAASRDTYEELEEAYRKERAAHGRARRVALRLALSR